MSKGLITTSLPSDFSIEDSGYAPAFITRLIEATQKGRGALLFISIDNLEMMISGQGYAMSENVMHALRAVIGAELPEGTEVDRVQRDQFACLIPGVSEKDGDDLCARIDQRIRSFNQNNHSGMVFCLSKTACIAFGETTTNATELLARGISKITDAGEDVVSDRESAADVSALSRQHMETANMLTQAMEENRFRLAFQPIIESKTGRIAHYEALLRLYSRDGKISSAGTLIPIAERMGMVHLLDQLTLEMVVKELRGDPDVVMAFNVSNETTRSREWMKKFKQYLTETPEIAVRMIAEITETAAHRDLKQVASFCAEVQSFGVEVALDDFGSGYTSFRQLKALSVDLVKIDGSFIKDLTDNADSRFFVKTLLDFTAGFGLKSVAEFVENGETAKMLMELGVDYLQGYYFGKPENVRRWLNQGEYSRG